MSFLYKLSQFLVFPSSFRAILFWPKFSLASFLIVKRLKSIGVNPKTVIDVGANVGQFAIAAHKLFKNVNVISVEANQDAIESFKRNIKNISKIDIISSAAGDYDGSAEFFINSDSQVSSLLELGNIRSALFPKSTVILSKVVPISKLDNLLSNSILNEPILLKLDVQGAEEKVLLGADLTLQRVKWVLIEFGFFDLYKGEPSFDAIYKMMIGHGFIFKGVMNVHLSPDGSKIIEMDALFSKT
jgi:FkbM family methyltransferase